MSVRPPIFATMLTTCAVAMAFGASVGESVERRAEETVYFRTLQSGEHPVLVIALVTDSGNRSIAHLVGPEWPRLALKSRFQGTLEDIVVAALVYDDEGRPVDFHRFELLRDLAPRETTHLLLSPEARDFGAGQQVYLLVESWRSGSVSWEIPRNRREALVDLITKMAVMGPRRAL